MPIIDGKKVACWPCIRGHRVGTCNHAGERPMMAVRRPGRPLSSCPHLPSAKCDCNRPSPRVTGRATFVSEDSTMSRPTTTAAAAAISDLSAVFEPEPQLFLTHTEPGPNHGHHQFHDSALSQLAPFISPENSSSSATTIHPVLDNMNTFGPGWTLDSPMPGNYVVPGTYTRSRTGMTPPSTSMFRPSEHRESEWLTPEMEMPYQQGAGSEVGMFTVPPVFFPSYSELETALDESETGKGEDQEGLQDQAGVTGP